MQEIINRIFLKDSKNISAQTNPIAYILGGQPGAGKSKLIQKIRNDLNGNVFVINADEYRKYHPQYNQFQLENDKISQEKTANFIARISEALLVKAIHNRLHLVIEGTFRTSTTPLNTIKLLKNNGYEPIVNILLTSKYLSWNSCIERYEKAPRFKRYTPKEHHDLVVVKIAQNIKEVLDEADKFEIFIRDFKNNLICFFNKNKNIYDTSLVNEILNSTNQNELEHAVAKLKLKSENQPKTTRLKK